MVMENELELIFFKNKFEEIFNYIYLFFLSKNYSLFFKNNLYNLYLNLKKYIWGLGIGDWGLGIGD